MVSDVETRAYKRANRIACAPILDFDGFVIVCKIRPNDTDNG